MLRTILIPISYIIGIIIAKITKEELIIRKNWLKKWKYLLLTTIIFFFIDKNLSIIMLCLTNYVKATKDLIFKTKIKQIIINNIIFLASGIILLLI
jgi:hypothetical protein